MPQTFIWLAISQFTQFGKLDFLVVMATREPHLHHCAGAGEHKVAPPRLFSADISETRDDSGTQNFAYLQTNI